MVKFIDTYVAHATVVRIIIQAEPVEEDVFADGIRLLFSLSEAITTGMTAAVRDTPERDEHPELTATACLLMLQQVSYLISEEMPLPRDEMAARVAYIIYAAFSLPPWPDSAYNYFRTLGRSSCPASSGTAASRHGWRT